MIGYALKTHAERVQRARLYSDRVQALNWMQRNGIKTLVPRVGIKRPQLPLLWAEQQDKPF